MKLNMDKEALRYSHEENRSRFKNENRPAVLILDQPYLVSPMIRELEDEGFEPSVAQSIPEASAFLSRYPAQIVVADTQELRIDLEDLRELNKPFIVTGVTKTQEEQAMRTIGALNAGADFYLKKPIEPGLLPAYIRVSLRTIDLDYTDPRIRGINEVTFNAEESRIFIGGVEVKLTIKECNLLNILTANPGGVIAGSNISQQMWGMYNPENLRMTISNLRKKLNRVSGGSGDLIETVWGVGYKFKIAE